MTFTKAQRKSDAVAKLTFRLIPFANETERPEIFVTVPEAHLCGMFEKVSVWAKDIKVWEVPEGATTVRFDDVAGGRFFLYGA